MLPSGDIQLPIRCLGPVHKLFGSDTYIAFKILFSSTFTIAPNPVDHHWHPLLTTKLTRPPCFVPSYLLYYANRRQSFIISCRVFAHPFLLPDGGSARKMLVRKPDTQRNFSYPSRTAKPVSPLYTAQTPRTPWQSLEASGGHAAATKSDAEDQDSLNPEYLAYLTLLEPTPNPGADEENSETTACKNDLPDAEFEEYLEGDTLSVMTDLGDLIAAFPQPKRPKYIDLAAIRRANATLDITPCSSPEKSPLSPSFSHRGFSLRRKSTVASQSSSSRSSTDEVSMLTTQTTKSIKRSSRETRSGWLSQIKEWTSVAEPSSQAIKQHKAETFGRAGITPRDPRAKAKLNLPTATLPPEAIKPAGRPLKPDEIMKRQAGERKKQERWSMSSMGRLSHTSLSSMSGHSSSSSLGFTSTGKADH